MKTISMVIKTVLIAIVALFAALNMQSVDIKYFFNKLPIQLPLFVVVIIAFILGILISAFMSVVDKLKLRKEINQLRKENKELEKEIVRLKNLPLSKDTDNNEQKAD